MARAAVMAAERRKMRKEAEMRNGERQSNLENACIDAPDPLPRQTKVKEHGKNIKNINLRDVAPIEFEALCGEIFSEYYGVPAETTPASNDEGKDLVIHFPDGDVFAECKHYLGGTPVGRPIVQKLQGAMTSEGIARGMVITTGRFANDVARYVKEKGLNIELIDLPGLVSIGARVGYHLTVDNESLIPQYVKPVSDDKLMGGISRELSKKLTSHPTKVEDLVRLTYRNTHLVSFYRVEYKISARFENSTHDEIHAVDEMGCIYIRESDGAVLSGSEFDMIDKKAEDLPVGCDLETQPVTPLMTSGTVKELGVNHIISYYTKDVMYTARNGRGYVKKCEPSKKDILIKDIHQIYIPYSEIKFSIIESAHRHAAYENGRGLTRINRIKTKCEICREDDAESICNECGKMVDRRHGVTCSICDKTTCVRCGGYYRKFLLFKKPICKECAEKKHMLKIKRYKE